MFNLDGQTGSGKTYTMFGEDGEIRGMIPRSVEYLFDVLSKRAATNEVIKFQSLIKFMILLYLYLRSLWCVRSWKYIMMQSEIWANRTWLLWGQKPVHPLHCT